jgi:glycine oxidase
MPTEVSPTQVAVVGGGVIGAACARAAAQRGLGVTLFAPAADPAAASGASAGMLAAQIEEADESFVPLAVRARDYYGGLAPALKDTTGIDIGLRSTGIATLALDEAEAIGLRQRVASQRQAGLRCDWLDEAELHERWPGANPAALGALYAPEDGCLDPAALTAALQADARRLGARIVPQPVGAIVIRDGRLAGVEVGGTRIAVEHVVIAAGAWSPQIGGLPGAVPVTPVRGQLVATAWPDTLPPTILFHGHGYLLPRGDQAILGSTMEHVGFDARTTPEGIARIRTSASALCPVLATFPTVRSWAGLRPMTPDTRPIVGPDPEAAGLWYATGHGRNGILLAGITGAIIADLLATGRTDVDLAGLSVDRFRATSPESASQA